ncbi:hypothetical protein F5Y15DRAFT_79513 [Xylariaceae sp. FL0016]|nr:hypothetical protein F5Y15DRAFT_79513 [Xylariaceae sp. FL0016]
MLRSTHRPALPCHAARLSLLSVPGIVQLTASGFHSLSASWWRVQRSIAFYVATLCRQLCLSTYIYAGFVPPAVLSSCPCPVPSDCRAVNPFWPSPGTAVPLLYVSYPSMSLCTHALVRRARSLHSTYHPPSCYFIQTLPACLPSFLLLVLPFSSQPPISRSLSHTALTVWVEGRSTSPHSRYLVNAALDTPYEPHTRLHDENDFLVLHLATPLTTFHSIFAIARLIETCIAAYRSTTIRNKFFGIAQSCWRAFEFKRQYHRAEPASDQQVLHSHCAYVQLF